VPLIIYLVAFLMLGSEVRFTKKPEFWLPVLVSGSVVGLIAFPFKRTPVWVAALVGSVIGLGLVAAYLIWVNW
jgi:hypothetical protein